MAAPRLWRWVLALGLPAAALAAYGCSLVGGITPPLPSHCADGSRDDDETGVDCGGSCAGCPGEKCASGDDCASELCNKNSGLCTTPADAQLCFPGQTATDCRFCHACDVGTACVFDVDCASGLCVDNVCANCKATGPLCHTGDCTVMAGIGSCLAVICANGVMDNGETGVDCGGLCSNVCCDGGACTDAGDPGKDAGDDAGTDAGSDAAMDDAGGDGASDAGGDDASDAGGDDASDAGGDDAGGDDAGGDDAGMDAGSDAAASLCSDGIKDGAETGVDCGGGTCSGCLGGGSCKSGSDCASHVCVPVTLKCL